MRAQGAIPIIAGAVVLAQGCGGISDCKEDGALCAQMLTANGEKCAAAYQLKQSDKKKKYCEAAIKVVAEQRVKDAVPGLIRILEQPESGARDDKHREEAAKALGRIGDPSAADALVRAIEFSAGTSSDPKDKQANRTNEAIATALGKTGAKQAVPKLLELMDRSGDNYVVLKAIRSVGELGASDAIDKLAEIALEHPNKFMRKNAVEALGDIADPKATDALIQMMFVEFQGVSFYKEASFALYEVGPAVADALLETMDGKNAKVNEYFEKTGGIKDSAIKAKCGFVLGDLRDARAVEPLIKAFKDAAGKDDAVVLAYAAAPLGALGDRRAVPVLKEQMSTLDASIRDPIMRALNMLGDRSVVPEMIDAMTKDHFIKACMKSGNSKGDCDSPETKGSLQGAQKAAADHASNLAGREHLAAFKKVVDDELDAEMKKYLEARLARVQAAEECKEDAGCWTKKLADPDPLVRERAAWELGRLKDPSTMDALAKALSDKKPEARSAAIMAYWSFGDARSVPAIEKQLDDESSMADFVRVNEDLKRLLVHLRRMKT